MRRRDRTPWRQARFVVVDLELTGLDPAADQIISFAGIPVRGGAIELAAGVFGLVRPTAPINPRAAEVHGLLPADLADAPRAVEALRPLLALLADHALVAHAAWVERTFLERELGRPLAVPVIDTAALARRRGSPARALPGDPPPLSRLAAELGLPVHRPHTADGDALTTAQVFLALAAHLDRRRRQTVRSLARRR